MLRIALFCISLFALTGAAGAQQPQSMPEGIKRTPLQKIEFPEGYTTVTGIAEVAAGVSAGRHSHPGVETGYVLEGESELTIDGKDPIRLKAGDSYQIPAGAVHDVKALGDKPTKVLGIYIIERGKPLAAPAK